ncbi:hypothetical protein SAMN05421504_102715 [Amycolatopsis xylanica]|uniref:Uncharacterized protein n=1 Tax=Amycolatopsis xylanica TaxID=589385 RepID=A0A1H2ZZ87_9PSEU|nr:hypothetical protein [Amycolatopsis xylanica]SDX22288.1 hypothetical protein SAMN05421504_102715 [Amycolatopsis xylanica]
MDDRELERLFAGAPGEPPPPSFDHGDIVSESKKITARRRRTLGVAGTFAVLVLFGFGAIRLSGAIGGMSETASAPGNAAVDTQSGGSAQPLDTTGRPPNGEGKQSLPGTAPMQGGDGSGKNGPRAGSAFGCEAADGELATALAGELSVPVTAPSYGRICVTGARSAGFQVNGGDLSIALVSSGAAIPQEPNSVTASATTATGLTLVIRSVSTTGNTTPPFAADLSRAANRLAAKF